MPRAAATDRRPSGAPALVALAAAAAVLVAAVTAVTAVAPRTSAAHTLGDLTQLVSAVLAVLGCRTAARRGGPAARAWTLLSVAAATWAAGLVVWTWYGLTRDHAYPFPSLADAGFLGYGIFAVAGLLLFPRAATRQFSRPREVLDAVVVAGSLLFVSWATVLGPLVSAGGPVLTQVVSLGYPIVDIAVASVVLILGTRIAPGARRSWLLLGTGMLVLAVTDSVYVAMTASGQTGTIGSPLVAGWTTAWLLVAFAGWLPSRSTEARQRHFTVLQELLPGAPVLAAVAVTAVSPHVSRQPVLVVLGGVVLVALVAQQIVVALEKVRLANGLEETVQARTTELRRPRDASVR